MGGSGGRPRQGNVGCMLPVQAAVSQSHILVETVLAPCLLTRSAQPVHGPHAQALPCLQGMQRWAAFASAWCSKTTPSSTR